MTIKQTRNNAYLEAAKIDAQIDQLLRDYPPDKNPEFWLTLCRTVKSGLDIIETISIETLRIERRLGT